MLLCSVTAISFPVSSSSTISVLEVADITPNPEKRDAGILKSALIGNVKTTAAVNIESGELPARLSVKSKGGDLFSCIL